RSSPSETAPRGQGAAAGRAFRDEHRRGAVSDGDDLHLPGRTGRQDPHDSSQPRPAAGLLALRRALHGAGDAPRQPSGPRAAEGHPRGLVSVRRPVFYYDLYSPYSYLAASRVEGLLGEVEWRPVWAYPIVAPRREGWRPPAAERRGLLDDIEDRARRYG